MTTYANGKVLRTPRNYDRMKCLVSGERVLARIVRTDYSETEAWTDDGDQFVYATESLYVTDDGWYWRSSEDDETEESALRGWG